MFPEVTRSAICFEYQSVLQVFKVLHENSPWEGFYVEQASNRSRASGSSRNTPCNWPLDACCGSPLHIGWRSRFLLQHEQFPGTLPFLVLLHWRALIAHRTGNDSLRLYGCDCPVCCAGICPGGEMNDTDARFCDRCGRPLEVEDAPQA